ncbi:MAG: DUF1152 domain-containing protein [Candidatus Thiodiazotropha sp.]
MQIPFIQELTISNSILIAGAGGGFDIVHGLPLYLYLRSLDKKVVLANLSFTELQQSECTEVFAGTYQITGQSKSLAYFPEKNILNWLYCRNESPSMYAFSNEMGVVPLWEAYSYIVDSHAIDTLILIDGGTDSLMFGDETKVGTIVEDSCSIVATSELSIDRKYLAAIGFGVEHNIDHHSCLENIATLIKTGNYMGALSLTDSMPEGKAYIDLVEYLNATMTEHESIVSNSVASAMHGEFGDFHPTKRTQNSVQFISPLMSIFWFFRIEGIIAQLRFASEIKDTTTMYEITKKIQKFRYLNKHRSYKNIPLK